MSGAFFFHGVCQIPTELSETQINQLRDRLKQRFYNLKEEIRQELLASDEEQYIRLAGEVNDTGDQSVADLLVDISLAVLDQHINEIRDIEAALLRISSDLYGTCINCGDDIDYQRLQAGPSAKRCYTCQVRYERTHAQRGHSTL